MKRMKSRIFLVFILLFIAAFQGGCNNKKDNHPQFADGKFVSIKSTVLGIEETYKCYTINVDLNQNGEGLIYVSDISEEFDLEDCPDRAFKLSEEDVNTIKDTLIEKDVFNMRQDVGNKDMTYGERKTVIVYTDSGEFQTGGLNPSNRDFLSIYDMIYSMAREEIFIYTKDIDSRIAKQYNARISGENIIISDILQYQLLTAKDIEKVYVESVEVEAKKDSFEEMSNPFDYSETDQDEEKVKIIKYLVIKLNEVGTEIIDKHTEYCESQPEIIKVSYMGDFIFQFDVSSHIQDGELWISEEYINEDINELAEKLQEVIDLLHRK